MEEKQEYAGLKRQLLQTFIPLNVLTEDHLDTLLRDTRVEVVCRGQTVCRPGDYDHQSIFLLSGRLQVGEGRYRRDLAAHEPAARFAVANHQPRLEPVIAAEDSEIICFDTDLLDGMVAWDQAASYIALDIASRRDLDEDAEWMLTLLRSNLFYKVPPMNIRQIIDRFKPHFVHSGEVVVRQGELGDCCYFVKEGRVGIYQGSGDLRGPALAELGPGRCFGEDALVKDQPRNASAVMLENGVLMRLDKQDFFRLLKSPAVRTLSLPEVQRELASGAGLIDVRTEEEFERAHAVGALNMPLAILKLKSRLLVSDRTYVIYCDTGRRSLAAAHLLAEEGFSVIALRHGLATLDPLQRLRFLMEGDADYLHNERQLARVASS